jgi:hypothetical protein
MGTHCSRGLAECKTRFTLPKPTAITPQNASPYAMFVGFYEFVAVRFLRFRGEDNAKAARLPDELATGPPKHAGQRCSRAGALAPRLAAHP